ncbi:unnamed protein product [Rhodiola kirilowii]
MKLFTAVSPAWVLLAALYCQIDPFRHSAISGLS